LRIKENVVKEKLFVFARRTAKLAIYLEGEKKHAD